MTKYILTLATLSLSLSLSPALASVACYTNPGHLVLHSQSPYQSRNLCQQHCIRANQTVSAVHNGNACYCGTESQAPSPDAQVSSSECSVSCPGWPGETCGGPNTWTITILPSQKMNSLLNRRIDPSTESVIVTAPDTDDEGKSEGTDPLDSLSVNPTVVQTGIELPTGSAGAIDGFKTAPIPSDILTAPSDGETGTSVPSAQGGVETSSMVVVPPGSTATSTSFSGVGTAATATTATGPAATGTSFGGSGSGSVTSGGGGGSTGTTAGVSGTASPSPGVAAAGAVVPSGLMMLMSGLVALFC